MKRGKFLTVLLVLTALLLFLGIISQIVNLFIDLGPNPFLEQSSFAIIIHTVILGLSFLSLYGLWKWKKWGVYMLVGVFIASFLHEYSVIGGIVVGNIFDLLFAGLWIWAIKRKWKYFS